jgi:hypothetical protein
MLARVSRVAVLAALVLLAPARWVEGQVTVGGALVLARTTLSDPSPSWPSAVTEPGAVVFVGVGLGDRVGVQGELSVPRRTVLTLTSSHYSWIETSTYTFRDTLLSGLVWFRASSWCRLLAGAGVVFASSSETDVVVDRQSGHATTTEIHVPDTIHLALTAGGDFPIRLNRRLWLLPTARAHWVYRGKRDSYSNGAFRVGIGAMVAF